MTESITRNVSPDDGIVASFARGAWNAHVIDRSHPSRPGGSGYMVRLDHPGGVRTSWPTQYDGGRIGYEHEPSRDARRATTAAFRWVNEQRPVR